MSWGGTRTYKHPLNSMGWANEEQPQTSQGCLNCYKDVRLKNMLSTKIVDSIFLCAILAKV